MEKENFVFFNPNNCSYGIVETTLKCLLSSQFSSSGRFFQEKNNSSSSLLYFVPILEIKLTYLMEQTCKDNNRDGTMQFYNTYKYYFINL